MSRRISFAASLFTIGIWAAGCVEPDAGDDHGSLDSHAVEVISKVELTFAPVEGGAPVVAAFVDPPGAESGTADPIRLALGMTYALSISLTNHLADPPEDITEEIKDEAEDHLVLIHGNGVSGPASASGESLVSQAYADLESDYGENAIGDDLPVGLLHTIVAERAGTAELFVMLRHIPAVNDQPLKTAELPQEFADGESLPGDVDVNPKFELTVE